MQQFSNQKQNIRFLPLAFLLVLLPLLLFVFPHTGKAASQYSFENSEKLKPLISWRDYGQDAFDQAAKQNKPIFLLLTAPSWCYWCQVYESKDYLFNDQLYPYINENFIPIYVDADQRQDLTRKYLEGGWPSTTIMAPNGQRIYGYSGPRPIENMLVNLKQAVQYVQTNNFSSSVSYNYKKEDVVIPVESQLSNLIAGFNAYILQSYDSVYGGFGTGQKFPQGRTLDFALDVYDSTKNASFLTLVQNTLKNQYTNIKEIASNYHLFDPVEGGFHRYGTTQQWTPPHYEKMLYDNARLLKAYTHLQQIVPNNAMVNEVVTKTNNYILSNWYDAKNGGFYGNTDASPEEAYYGKNPRPAEKPRIEKTKYADWNAEAILTYLYLWQKTGSQQYRAVAKKSLDFFLREMVTDKGVYHFEKEDGSKGVQGSLLDNAYMLLAFTKGYEVLQDMQYLQTAKKIADYSLENLYDWNSGGFFERNSPDSTQYAQGENIDLSKPSEENGVITYAMLKLYQDTHATQYLDAGIKTLGNQENSVGQLDQGYYVIQAAQLTVQSNLLSDYNAQKDSIAKIESEKLQNFWVNNLVNDPKSKTGFTVSNRGLHTIGGPLWLLLLVAFFAGLLSLVSPCCLPIIPAYVAYTFESSKKNVIGMAFSFFLGMALVFSLLGMTATFIGNFLRSYLTIFSQVAGIGLILFGIYILLGKGFYGFRIKQTKPTTYASAFLFGSILGLSWTPCMGPILVAIILLASTSGSALTGGLLLFTYTIGFALPLLLLSIYLNKLDRNGKIWKVIQGKEIQFSFNGKIIRMHTTSMISGLLFIVLGFLIFSGTLYTFNKYVTGLPFQQWIFLIEDKLLHVVK